MKAIVLTAAAVLILCAIQPARAAGQPKIPEQPGAAMEARSFTATGILVADDGTPIKNARVVAVPVKANGGSVRFYAFDESGKQQMSGPSARTDSKGQFSIVIPREFQADKEFIKKWTLCLPGFGPPDTRLGWPATDVWLEMNGQPVSIAVNDKGKPVDLGKITVK